MSFGGGWQRPPGGWPVPTNEAVSWRPYENNTGGGRMMREPPRNGNSRNGWANWLSDPYFSRNLHVQSHMTHYERNRMHLFNQPQAAYHQPTIQRPLRKPILETPVMNELAKQRLLENAHVPGLRTGLQLRDAMQKRKNARELQEVRKIAAKPITVKVSVNSEKIELEWENPEPSERVKYVVNCECIKTKAATMVLRPSSTPFCEFKVIAGEIYKLNVACHRVSDDTLLGRWTKEVRAEFSYSELKHLLHKCYHFISRGNKSEPQMHQFCVAYRCKPKVYWDEIHHYYNDVMQKYIKDDNGQPGNLINGKINGLFFSARLLTDLSLPQCSPFGNVRMIIDAFRLLNPSRHNFYFADFYCNKNIHYVTIVICVIDSETDRYCRERLIKLNPLSNPFVKLVPPIDHFGQWRFFINYTVWVELYFTEDIQLNMGQFSAIMATGAGTSKIGGLPNNKQCNICNLYPTGKKKKTVIAESEKVETDPSSMDSTMATILRESKHVDNEVADVICYLVDRVEEASLTTEELTAKLDVNLVEAVEKMNNALALTKDKVPTPMENSFSVIAKNLSEFVTSFNSRRDALIQNVAKLKKQSEGNE